MAKTPPDAGREPKKVSGAAQRKAHLRRLFDLRISRLRGAKDGDARSPLKAALLKRWTDKRAGLET